MALTDTWTIADPKDDDQIAAGPAEIREVKTSTGERLGIDHYAGRTDALMNHADTGKHKWCQFIEAADLGTGAAGYPIFGAQTVSGVAELMFTTEGDVDLQLTSGSDFNIDGDISMSGMTGTVTDLTITSEADGDLLQFDGTNWVRVPKGSAYEVLKSDGTNVGWGSAVKSVLDYGSSASASTAKYTKDIHVCYGSIGLAGGNPSSQAITNLPFTSSTSYSVVVSQRQKTDIDGNMMVVRDSGAQFTISHYYVTGSIQITWIAIGT